LVEKNGNRLVVDVDADIGEMEADATKLRQILFNLLGNAAKFTDHGTIRLSVAREADPAGDWLTFAVADAGIGMTEEQLGRLFRAFAQADASTSRRFGGTGLGLALVHHFCEMLGGTVTVTSAPGAGSTFTVRLPAQVSTPESRLPTDEPPSETPRAAEIGADLPVVLVVDDDAAARDLLRRHLEAEGVRVVTAGGGQEGLRLARELRPALITLDVLMPGLDGWAVLGALKGDAATADIPVIMLTILDDRNLGYTLGAADYLTKPIDRGQLAAVLRTHIRVGGTRRALVIEDDPATRELLRRTLQREGWIVDEAANGRAGLDQVAAARPDLILLDLLMSELDGFGFLARLRAEPAWSGIPVLVVTAKELTSDERQMLSGSVEQIIQKGAYARDALLAEVRELVRASVNQTR
jgi:DNA-binding response OmpR family regulator